MSHRIGRWTAAIARAGIRLILLVLLVAGIPAVLLNVGTLPHHVPSPQDLGNALMAPDDGSLLITVLTLAAWIAWLWLLIPLLVETSAVLIRRSTPRLPGMVTGQRLATYLLGGLLLASPAAVASAATPAVAATLPLTTSNAEPAADATAAPTSSAAAPEAASATQVHHVADDGVIAYDIAEQRLGDGLRWKDLAHLNPDLHITAATFEVPVGSVLTLPADARPASSPAAHTSTAHAEAPDASEEGGSRDEAREYVVQPGDYLSKIAQEQLGDASQWPDLYAANKGEQQPYGHTFTNPDLIYAGQEITLPADADRPSEHAPSQQRDSAGQDDGGQGQDAAPTPGGEQDKGSQEAAEPSAAPQDTPSPAPGHQESAAPAPADSAAPAPGSTPAAETGPSSDAPRAPQASAPDQASDGQESDQGRHAGVFGLAATGVLAFGFLSVLGYRRIMQMRRRRRGRHIALPQGEAARAEHALRVAEATTDTAVLDAVLRTAAVHLTDAGRELPQLTAAVVGERTIVLHLAEPAAPVPPFSANPEALQQWTCPAAATDVLPQADTDDVDPPYPALVSLGWDPDGRLILVDLEHIGHLHLTGPAASRVAQTLALELATSEFTHHLDLGVVGDGLAPGLGQELPERVTLHPGLDTALSALRTHHSEQQRALEVLGAATMRHARTGVDTAAAWTPYLVVAGSVDDEATALDGLLESVSAEPRSATALITSGDLPAGLPDDSWTLHVDHEAGPMRLPIPGIELECTVQALSDDDFTYALQILATTREGDVPAPEPEPEAQVFEGDPFPLSAAESDDGGTETAVPDPDLRPVTAEAGTAGAGQVPNLLAQFATFDDSDGSDEDESSAAPAEVADESGPGSEDLGVLDKRLQDPALSRGPVPAQQSLPAAAVSVRLPDPARGPVLVPASELDGSPADSSQTTKPAPPGLEPSDTSSSPVVRVLGPVDITGTRGTTERKRERTSIELAAWLVLHPGRDHHALDEAMWPDRVASRKYRNATVSRLRTWLGDDDNGKPYLPAISATPDARYAFSPAVDCDWHQFQRLVRTGKQAGGPQADQALRNALELVAGRPFSSSDRSRYRWAEHLALVMIMDIVDAAEILSERLLAARDPRGALWAATKGLDVAPEVESLYRILFRAYAAIGDHNALERAARKLQDFNEDNDIETEEDTLAILNELMAKV
ncbi:LysM peptidoglycan-binding domain-containing protein [Streptomyces sp. NPDC051664]|uniref:LysM peptidoglycan-binding domain-containing protein n=1 Tax=Streptomyces sp. NPDC051664 TaxID=3365668 RepID=UPI0037B74B7D